MNAQNTLEMLEPIVITKECSICYENIKDKNNCTTQCGHMFCFNCMIQSLKMNTTCPLCRTELDEQPDISNDDEDDDETYDDGESDISSLDIGTNGEGEDDDDDVEIEKVVDEFQKHGYDLKDAISLLLTRYSKTDTRYTKDYISKLENDFDEFYERLYMEKNERSLMNEEDRVV